MQETELNKCYFFHNNYLLHFRYFNYLELFYIKFINTTITLKNHKNYQ